MQSTAPEAKGPTSIDANALAKKILSGETNIKQTLGISDPQMEAIYLVAYNSYKSGKYEESLKIFGMIVGLNPMEGKYWYGLAACCQQLEYLAQAGFFYYISSAVGKGANPEAFLHLAECLIMLDDPIAAKFNLEKMIERFADKPEDAQLVERARLMLKHL
jgi:type III secretion system low calcium response chaperone LcrH/SycD